jgi:hypothetical protein
MALEQVWSHWKRGLHRSRLSWTPSSVCSDLAVVPPQLSAPPLRRCSRLGLTEDALRTIICFCEVVLPPEYFPPKTFMQLDRSGRDTPSFRILPNCQGTNLILTLPTPARLLLVNQPENISQLVSPSRQNLQAAAKPTGSGQYLLDYGVKEGIMG